MDAIAVFWLKMGSDNGSTPTPEASTLLDLVLRTPGPELAMLSPAFLASVCGGPASSLAAAEFLVDAGVLDRFYLLTVGGEEFEMSASDVADGERLGVLIHPETGNEVASSDCSVTTFYSASKKCIAAKQVAGLPA